MHSPTLYPWKIFLKKHCHKEVLWLLTIIDNLLLYSERGYHSRAESIRKTCSPSGYDTL